jgi:transposase
MMLYLGCDQHAKQVTVCLRDEAGTLVLKRQVSTKPEKMDDFFIDLNQRASAEGYMAILEVCGFNDWFLDRLQQAGCKESVVVHPDKPGKKKTDRRDADKLSTLLWVHRDQLRNGQKPIGLRRVVMPSPEDAESRQLTLARQRVGQQRTRAINAVQAILRKHNLPWQQPTKGIETQAAKRWLKELTLPVIDRLEMNHLLARWELCDQQRTELDAAIAKRAALSRAVQLIKTAPGFSDYGALGIASRIGDIARFQSPRSLANYFGLTPSSRSSGEKSDRLGSITKQGSRFARFLLGQVVLHVLKRDKDMRAWYQRIKRRRGSKIARVAVMRRLCTILWHMLTYEEAYAFGGPPRLRHRRSPRPNDEPALT